MSAIPLRRIEGKYEILEKLGEGGMGAVYKVRHRLLDDVRVIKMMRPQLVADEEFKARFQREARVAIQLRHPNIAHLIDFTIDDEDGTAFIVMEFIDGMTLEEVLRHNGPPPLALAVEIGLQSLRALACLHEKGFVHRDISPDNLMLTADVDGQPLVKLIDLGIAKILGAGGGTGGGGANLTGTGIFLGKVRYSSPEQFGTEGAAMVDARGDLYSFGIVLYELLTGKYPIQGRDPSSLIAGHLFRPPLDFAESDPGGRVPAELRALILRVLAKEPAQRLATSRELGTALARFRAPGEIADGDLRRALARLPGGTVRVPLTPPGSTQDRLNLQFGLHTTPAGGDGGKTLPPPRRSPESELRIRTLLREAEALLDRNDYEGALAHLERGKALAPGNLEMQALIDKAEAAVRQRRRTRDLTGVLEAIEAALGRHDYRAAEMRLYQAEASFGEQEAFSRLHERLGELRRRDLEARRRAERLVAAVREIEAAFTRGDLDEGDRLLTTAESAFGDDPEIAAFRRRLAALRQAALQSAVAALVESGEHRRQEDDLAGALAEARRALDLDPESGAAKALAEAVTVELARREEAARQAEIAAAQEARALAEEAEAERRRREDEARRLAREAEAAARLAAEIAAHLERARELRVADDLEGALVAAGQALALEPGNGDALHLAGEIEAEAYRRKEEAERAARQAAAIAAIEARLAEGNFSKAGALLDETHSSFGELESFRDLRARLEELRREAREAEAAGFLARARELRERDDLEGALSEARRVLLVEVDPAPARSLIAEIETERRRREKEAERAEQLAAAVAAIDVCLDAQDPEAAARLLPGIVSIFGDAPALRERWERIEELRRQKTRERVDHLLDQARKLRDEGELEAALGGLREAGRLAPEDSAARSLVGEVEAAIRQRDEESRQQRELETTLATIDEALERVDPAAAARLLPAAVARFGGTPALRERWERLEALQRKARVEVLRGEAASLVQAGHRDRAARKLRQALELDPGDRGIQELLARLGKG